MGTEEPAGIALLGRRGVIVGECETWQGLLLVEDVRTDCGPMLAAGSGKGVAALLPLHAGEEAAQADLAQRWPAARFAPAGGRLAALLGADPVPLVLVGTGFQRAVWRALLDIATGERTNYAALAAAIGRPRAVRAVGTAVGRNPLAVLVPCHRVARSDGGPGGYRWGLDMKARLLAREAPPA